MEFYLFELKKTKNPFGVGVSWLVSCSLCFIGPHQMEYVMGYAPWLAELVMLCKQRIFEIQSSHRSATS